MLAKSSPRPRFFTVAIVTPRRDLYRAAADCLRNSANLSWTERLDWGRGSVPTDAVLVFADDFNMIDAYGLIERELLNLHSRCLVVVVARHRKDYESLTSLPSAANRLEILPISAWENDVLHTIRSGLESPA